MSSSFERAKKHLLGRPLRSSEEGEQKYGVLWGLPVLSSDAISSVAYATEAILIVLVPVIGMASYGPMLGAAGVIIALLLMLIFCYRQVVEAYPHGGGAYSVARENLGKAPSLVAASGLIVDYVLTIAVSASSGAAAVTSAFPEANGFQVPIIVAFILLLTIGNLRGIRESSVAFGLPTYFFIVSILVMIGTGIVKAFVGGEVVQATVSLAEPVQNLTFFLFLRAFSSGCSALTGIEAISNSVSNFTDPPQRAAKRALLILGGIVFLVFGGVCMLAMLYHALPADNMTVVAQIAVAVFGESSVGFYVIQIATAVILLLAANTAYNGLPQLMSLLSRDGYLPKRFADKGSRLVYSSGVVFATIIAIILVVAFEGNTNMLLPLYAAGVFLSFTLAQTGMVIHWKRSQETHWHHKAFINGLGAVMTGIVFVVIITTRFTAGAWIALVAIALTCALMWSINHHYHTVEGQLSFNGDETAKTLLYPVTPRTSVVIPAYTVNKPFIKALNYARGLSDDIEIYHVKTSAAAARRFKTAYYKLGLTAPLVIEKAPYRNINEVLLKHIDSRISELQDGETLTVVMPQLVTKWYQYILHNQTTVALESDLLDRRDVVVVVIPYIIESSRK